MPIGEIIAMIDDFDPWITTDCVGRAVFAGRLYTAHETKPIAAPATEAAVALVC
jgi:hypothetical protein